MAPPLAALLRAAGTDLVVADTLTAAGGLAAELAGLPWVELVPHPVQLPSIALPPPGTGLAPGRTPLGRGRDALLRRLHARSVALGRRQRSAARVSIGLPADDPGPAHRLVATLPALEPPRPDWPDRTDIVGPLHWEPAQVDLTPPPGTGPLILVSPPTAASGRSGLVPTVLAAVAELRSGPDGPPPAPGRAAGGRRTGRSSPDGPPAASGRAAGGRRTGAERAVRGGGGAAGGPADPDGAARVVATVLAAGGPAPDWAAIGPGRQAPLLAAASVVVAGGGHGMVGKALAAGVPLVLVPGGGDQRDLSRRVARLGAGVVIEGNATPRRLAAALARVITEPGYRAAALAAAGSAASVTDPVRLCAHAVTERAEGSW